MDILKRRLAPISSEAWKEIDERAKEVLKSILSARKVLKINGPKGWDYTVVSEGRLENIKSEDDSLSTGTFKVKPLVEVRSRFVLNKWELDNIERGADDIDLSALEEAVEKIALFEEEALYNGNKDAGIIGLSQAAEHKMKLGKDGNEILKNIGEAKYALFNSYVSPPYDLVVSPEAYKRLNVVYEGANLIELIEKLIEGKVIRSKVVKGALLLPPRDEDFDFVVGQDFSIGYENDDNKTVTLFATESFTFRVLDESKIVNFTL